MLSVLVLARHYYPSPGAATNRLTNMVEALREAGNKVTVVTRTLPGLPRSNMEFGPAGERIVRVPADRTTGFDLRRAMQMVNFPLHAARLATTLVPEVDVIISDPPPTVGLAAAFVAHRSNCAFVYYLSDRWRDLMAVSTSATARQLAPLVGMLEDVAIRRAHRVVAATEHLAEYSRRLNSNVTLIPNGVDGRIFTPTGPPILDLAPSAGLPYFLYAGNFGEAHGASIFALASERLWRGGELGFGLTFVGYGSDAERIRRVAVSWPERLRMVDPAQPLVVAGAFRGALAGLASVKDAAEMRGAIPVKALASVMSGCPVLYAGGGSFRAEVEAGDMGIGCDTDVDQVAEAMVGFIRQPWIEARRMGLGAEARSRGYDNRGHGPAYKQLVEALGQTNA